MGSEYTTLSSDNYTVYTGASSSIYITSALTTEFPVEYTSDNNTQYVYRKHAFRTPKKKKGDLVDVNNPRHRIKNLLKPIVVFKFLKEGFKPIERKNLSNRLEKACQILESTSITNQIALREKIQAKFGKFLREQEMIACGFTMFLEREILQTFVDSVREKVVKITPIKNYVRLIPKEVKAKMEIAQERRLFDDYVVIHCDPENKAVEKTIEEKKDPILCGVIKESSRYYFVGDWMDEICDITMDSLLEHLGLDEEDVSLPNDVETALLEIL
jgi:hypothetical protein